MSSLTHFFSSILTAFCHLRFFWIIHFSMFFFVLLLHLLLRLSPASSHYHQPPASSLQSSSSVESIAKVMKDSWLRHWDTESIKTLKDTVREGGGVDAENEGKNMSKYASNIQAPFLRTYFRRIELITRLLSIDAWHNIFRFAWGSLRYLSRFSYFFAQTNMSMSLKQDKIMHRPAFDWQAEENVLIRRRQQTCIVSPSFRLLPSRYLFNPAAREGFLCCQNVSTSIENPSTTHSSCNHHETKQLAWLSVAVSVWRRREWCRSDAAFQFANSILSAAHSNTGGEWELRTAFTVTANTEQQLISITN